MPQRAPTKRYELIRLLRRLGFDGPFSGGNHQFMTRARLKLRIPNPHRPDISSALLIEGRESPEEG